MTHSEEYKQRLNSYQKRISVIQLFIMMIGLGIFSLGVVSRPILRITSTEFVPLVRWIVNVMVGVSVVQIVSACYDIFSSCWKLMWPIYLGIAGTSLTVLWELIAIGTSLFLYTRSFAMVNEEVVHPWYWVECLQNSNCHSRMLNYIHWYILPQVVMAVITVILQSASILMLANMVKIITNHNQVLHEAGEKYHDEWEEQQFNSKQEQSSQKAGPSKAGNPNVDAISVTDSTHDHHQYLEVDDSNMRTPRRVQFSDSEMSPMGSSARKRRGEQIEMVHKRTYEAKIHAVVEMATPNSILKGDHGYVAGSRLSLDFDSL